MSNNRSDEAARRRELMRIAMGDDDDDSSDEDFDVSERGQDDINPLSTRGGGARHTSSSDDMEMNNASFVWDEEEEEEQPHWKDVGDVVDLGDSQANFSADLGEQLGAGMRRSIAYSHLRDTCRSKACKVGTVLILVVSVIVGLVTVVLSSDSIVKRDFIEEVADPNSQAAQEEKPSHTGNKRFDAMFDMIRNKKISSRTTLDREDSLQRKALEWIANDDEAQLTAEDPGFMDRYILALFYFSKTEAWNLSNGWMSATPICQWHGVKCIDGELETHRSVKSIELVNNQIKGPVPSEVFKLQYLESLNLSNNKLTGFLPSHLPKAKKLKDVNLNDNTMRGPIHDDFTSNTKLTSLQLRNNYFDTTIPKSLGTVKSLQILDLSKNKLAALLPSELAGLVNLSKYIIGFWSSLMQTFLNNLTVYFLTIFFNSSEALILNNNELNGAIPHQLFTDMSNLETVSMHDNDFGSTIPSSMSKLRRLKTLDLSGNSLSGTIPNLIQATMLESLILKQNRLDRELPHFLGSLQSLKELELQNNGFIGKVPSQLGQLTKLGALSLHSNAFTGSMPDEICSLIDEASKPLQLLTADCSLDCSCCTECF